MTHPCRVRGAAFEWATAQRRCCSSTPDSCSVQAKPSDQLAIETRSQEHNWKQKREHSRIERLRFVSGHRRAVLEIDHLVTDMILDCTAIKNQARE